MVYPSGGVNNGDFENGSFNTFCNRLCRIDNNRITSGRQVSRSWNDRGSSRYGGQHKGRSMEGALVKSTKFLAVLFIVLAAVLNLKVFG